MSKQNLTPEQIIENILRPENKKKATAEERRQTEALCSRKKGQKEKKTLSKPQSVTIILDGDTYAKLQQHALELKIKNGDRSFSISKLGRELLEQWVEDNLKE